MTFKRARTGLVVSVATMVLLHLLYSLSLWWLALPTAAFGALLIYGSSVIQSNFYMNIHCSAAAPLKEIAITFDDGPNAEFTPKILSVLSEFGAPATFFLIGKNIRGNENLLKRIDSEGHIVGNHTFTHSFFIDFKRSSGFKDEINRTADAIQKVIGKRTKLFRPPYGVMNPQLAKASESLNYHVVGWNVRSFDTTANSEDQIAERVLKQIGPGAVILFHDASDKTVRVLERTLRYGQTYGYKIVSLERLMKLKPYE